MQSLITSFDPKRPRPFSIDLSIDGKILVGEGREFADAVLELAEKIKAYKFGQVDHVLAKALNQPTGSWPDIMPKHPADGNLIVTQKPSVGRIVWYYPVAGEINAHNPGKPLPAFVTRVVDAFTVNLQVILDGDYGGGTRFVPGVDYCGMPKPGAWSWPEKI